MLQGFQCSNTFYVAMFHLDVNVDVSWIDILQCFKDSEESPPARQPLAVLFVCAAPVCCNFHSKLHRLRWLFFPAGLMQRHRPTLRARTGRPSATSSTYISTNVIEVKKISNIIRQSYRKLPQHNHRIDPAIKQSMQQIQYTPLITENNLATPHRRRQRMCP